MKKIRMITYEEALSKAPPERLLRGIINGLGLILFIVGGVSLIILFDFNFISLRLLGFGALFMILSNLTGEAL